MADYTSNLMWHCPLQDNAASTTVVESITSTNGTLTGAGNTSASSVSGPGGIYPKALTFDGTDDYVATSFSSALTGNNATYAAFFKRNGTQWGYGGIIFCRYNSNPVCGMMVMNSTPELRFTWNSGAYNLTTGVLIPDNEWALVAAAVGPSSTLVYCRDSSGLQTANVSFTASSCAYAVRPEIGRDRLPTRFVKGEIAGARIYSRTLSEADLDALFYAAFPQAHGFDAYYRHISQIG